MKSRPLILKFIIAVYFLAPLFVLAQLHHLTYGGFLDVIPDSRFYSQFDLIRIAILLLYPIVGVLLYRVKESSWTAYSTHSFFLILLNAYEIHTRRSFPFGTLLFVMMAGFGITAFMNRRKLKEVFLNPRLRWWEIAERFACFIPVEIKTTKLTSFGFITDISKTGCFAYSETEFILLTPLELEITHQEIKSLKKVKAKVMRVGLDRALGLYGHGILFESVSPAQEKGILKILSHLKRRGAKDRVKLAHAEIQLKIAEFRKGGVSLHRNDAR